MNFLSHCDSIEFGDEDFSISCWIRYPEGMDPIALNRMNGWVVKGTNGAPGTGNRYQLFLDNDAVGKSHVEVDRTPFMTGDWVHVVAVRDSVNDELRLYADGILQGTATENSGDIYNGEPLRIGDCVSEDTPMMVDIDDVIIFAQALTAEEAAMTYTFFQPADGATEVARDTVFNWMSATGSASAYDLYLGTVALVKRASDQ